ncbi:MAG: regulatory protein NosR [endosymbiont of Galathealinum brachiosum]|uniref:Regulatory protein NosR n=1 Tax=endosymbiont of Galathealinum brachiosum TaxID=2200906 RepID=A0A370DMJ5_9GAMM|nr:MAG: regulatory protein NosR [endosymbiont of Galathealinum brachiosum]
MGYRNTLKLLFLLFLLQCLPISAVQANSELSRFLDVIKTQDIYPGANKLGSPTGDPVVAPAYKDGKQLGFVFLTSDYENSTGYSGKPIHQLVALDMQGIIKKVLLVEHHEPIVLIGIPESKITEVLTEYEGLDVGKLVRGTQDHEIDIVSGATVTVMVMDDNILRGSIKVARNYGLSGLEAVIKKAGPVASVNPDISITKNWQNLVDEGSVSSLKLTVGQINQAFKDSGKPLVLDFPEEGESEEVFIELYAAVVSIPSIGKSLLGENEYKNLLKKLKPGEQAIMLAGDGRFSFKGSGYVRGGIFDRFQIIQGDTSIRFHDRYHKRLRSIAADGSPDLKDVDLFRTPADLKFKGADAWKLELLVGRNIGPIKKIFLTFDLNYKTPDKYLIITEPEIAPVADVAESNKSQLIWVKMWELKTGEVIVLGLALFVLTLIFFFQNWLVKRPKLTEQVRIGFLIFTLFGIGWYFNAQLSVVNILAMFNALVSGFDWTYFLMEPLIFILWASVAASLLFWGRGAYCGWLCPFGAMQELLNKIAKAFKIKQISVPWAVHERVWTFKYLIFLGLFGLSLYSLEWAERLAEVEPFKTTIILKFVREWPYVIFALAVLLPGIFIERFYCRYLCPLGAALAIPGKMRMFSWLKRYKECGSPCQRCSNECMVQAIHPEGDIDVNECLYCLHCQVLYSDDHACPVMIQKRLKKERRSVNPASVKGKNGSAISIELEK